MVERGREEEEAVSCMHVSPTLSHCVQEYNLKIEELNKLQHQRKEHEAELETLKQQKKDYDIKMEEIIRLQSEKKVRGRGKGCG